MTTLTKKQYKTFRRDFVEGDKPGAIIAIVRYDDECGNGHNTFSITGTLYGPERQPGETPIRGAGGVHLWRHSFGCLHEDIAKHLTDLAPFIKWHSCGSDGPMHYVANTCYHALQRGPTHAWVYHNGPSDPLGIARPGERLIGYIEAYHAAQAEGVEGYRVEWDEKTIKVRDLDAARRSAVWLDATDEDLTAPDLEARLEARLPALLDEFRAAVESFGFTY